MESKLEEESKSLDYDRWGVNHKSYSVHTYQDLEENSANDFTEDL